MVADRAQASPWRVALALGIVYVVWGSTYAAIRVALEGFPPFLLGATRFLTAGAILLVAALALGHKVPPLSQLRGAAIVGVLLLFVGNGGVVWAEQHVASGLAAVIVATVPLWMVALDALFPRGERLSRGVVASTVLGLAGVALLMAGGIVLERSAGFWMGIAALLVASFGWALGSIYGRYAERPTSLPAYTAVQMIAGGVTLTAMATARGEWSRLEWSAIAGAPLWANLYLVTFGSLVAFSAYVWLLRAAPPALVGTYAYVNPVVALGLGVLLFGESLDIWTLAGSALILASVLLMQVLRARAGARAPAAAPAADPRDAPVPAAETGRPSPAASPNAGSRPATPTTTPTFPIAGGDGVTPPGFRAAAAPRECGVACEEEES